MRNSLILMAALFIVFVIIISLSGCAAKPDSVPVIVTKTQVLMPPDDYFNCPKVSLPPSEGLTDKKVASLLFTYDKANKTCRVNMDAIKKFLEENRDQSLS